MTMRWSLIPFLVALLIATAAKQVSADGDVDVMADIVAMDYSLDNDYIDSEIETTRQGGECPNQWIAYNTNCYFPVSQKTNWFYAARHCSKLGSKLLFVEDEKEVAFLQEKVQQIQWIGLFMYNGSQPKWVGMKKDKQQWNSSSLTISRSDQVFSHPDYPIRNKQNCYAISTQNTSSTPSQTTTTTTVAFRMACDAWLPYFCKGKPKTAKSNAQPEMVPDRCPQNWQKLLPDKNVCYRYIPTTLTWIDANALCQSEGGQLASISSENEQQAINAFIHSHFYGVWNWRVFIGGILWYREEEAQTQNYRLQWADDSDVQFAHVNRAGVSARENAYWTDVTVTSCLVNERNRWSVDQCTQRLPAVCKMALGSSPKDRRDPMEVCYNKEADCWNDHLFECNTFTAYNGHKNTSLSEAPCRFWNQTSNSTNSYLASSGNRCLSLEAPIPWCYLSADTDQSNAEYADCFQSCQKKKSNYALSQCVTSDNQCWYDNSPVCSNPLVVIDFRIEHQSVPSFWNRSDAHHLFCHGCYLSRVSEEKVPKMWCTDVTSKRIFKVPCFKSVMDAGCEHGLPKLEAATASESGADINVYIPKDIQELGSIEQCFIAIKKQNARHWKQFQALLDCQANTSIKLTDLQPAVAYEAQLTIVQKHRPADVDTVITNSPTLFFSTQSTTTTTSTTSRAAQTAVQGKQSSNAVNNAVEGNSEMKTIARRKEVKRPQIESKTRRKASLKWLWAFLAIATIFTGIFGTFYVLRRSGKLEEIVTTINRHRRHRNEENLIPAVSFDRSNEL